MPFTMEQFFDVFNNYNISIWPAQIFLNILALAIVYFAYRGKRRIKKFPGMGLAFLWLWNGIVYHFLFFAKINPAAYGFAAIFVIQGVLFFIYSLKGEMEFNFSRSLYGYTGGVFIVFALIVYPLLGMTLGHTYPSNPTFGLPCPTTIFTFGMLLWIKGKVPRLVAVIPFLWSLIGFTAALNLDVYEDTGLLFAGIMGITLIRLKNRKSIEGVRAV